MIEKLVSQSRTTEAADASVRMIAAFGQTSLQTDKHLEAIFNDLGALTDQLTAAIRRAKTESELELKDEVRDDKVRGLHYLVAGFAHHPDPAIKAAALALEKVLENYGLKITGDSYSTESALILSLLNDLKQAEYADKIAALSGCADLIAALESAQADFEVTRVTWEREKAIEGTFANATQLKKEVVAIINGRLVVYLRAMQQVKPDLYSVFTDTIGVIVAETNETVKRRRKKPEAPAA